MGGPSRVRVGCLSGRVICRLEERLSTTELGLSTNSTNSLKMTALLFFRYPTRDGMNKSAVISFCVLPQAHLF